MGKKGKRGNKPAAKKAILKRLDALAKNLEEELKDADLFGPPPRMDDCAICLVPLPRVGNKVIYQGCCGKWACSGCFKENERVIKKINSEKSGENVALACPFCRELEPTETGYVHQLEVRSSKGDSTAYNVLGIAFEQGHFGVTKDEIKGLDSTTTFSVLNSGPPTPAATLAFPFSVAISVSRLIRARQHYFTEQVPFEGMLFLGTKLLPLNTTSLATMRLESAIGRLQLRQACNPLSKGSGTFTMPTVRSPVKNSSPRTSWTASIERATTHKWRSRPRRERSISREKTLASADAVAFTRRGYM